MSLVSCLEALGQQAYFSFRALKSLPQALLARPGALLVQLQQIFLGALPLALVAGSAVGAVIWMHGRQPLRNVGGPEAESVLPQALALIVVLELAPIVAGLIVAGRTGSGLAAELGSMRQTEQIDALEMLGLSPWRELIGPRVLACMIALPLLTMFITTAALLTGLLAGNLSVTQYQVASLKQLHLRDVIPALLKTVAFGFLIGSTGCYQGMKAEGGTEGVGRAATRGVVMSILWVLIADVLLVLLTQMIPRK